MELQRWVGEKHYGAAYLAFFSTSVTKILTQEDYVSLSVIEVSGKHSRHVIHWKITSPNDMCIAIDFFSLSVICVVIVKYYLPCCG